MLPILYQDSRYVAIDKPPGLLVHRSRLIRGERRFAVQVLRDQLGQPVFPCHRLDKPTSGVLLFALDREALAAAQTAFGAGKVAKRYLAVVRGWTESEGRIDHPLAPKGEYRGEGPHEAREALTRYRRIAATELPHPLGRHPSARFSLVELCPETGRTHQLRRHMKHISHPIIGDTKHGDGRQNRFFREHFGTWRMFLTAVQIEMPHPFRNENLRVATAPDGEFAETLARAGLGKPCDALPPGTD